MPAGKVSAQVRNTPNFGFHGNTSYHKMSHGQRAFLGATHVRETVSLMHHQQEVVTTHRSLPNFGTYGAITLGLATLTGLITPPVGATHTPNQASSTSCIATNGLGACQPVRPTPASQNLLNATTSFRSVTVSATPTPVPTISPTPSGDDHDHDDHGHGPWIAGIVGGVVGGFVAGATTQAVVGKCLKKKEEDPNGGEDVPIFRDDDHFGSISIENPMANNPV